MYILLFPLILCTLPIHSIFAQNSTEISLKDYILTLLLFCLFIIGGTAILNYFIGDIFISELIFCLNFFPFIYAKLLFSAIFSEYKRRKIRTKVIFFILYITGSLLLSMAVICLFHHISPYPAAKFLFFLSAFISFFVYIDIIKKITCKKNQITTKNTLNKLFGTPLKLPDIYHIITDSHTGFDKKNYCDDYFKTELLKRGFTIYEKATSNYNYTFCSVPSILNMDYIENLSGSLLPEKTLQYYGKNMVFSILQDAGYNITATTFNLYKHLLNANKITLTLLRTILCTSLPYIFHYSIGSNLMQIRHELSNTLKKRNNKPTYFFGHLLAPHYPYLNKEDGSKIPVSEQQNIDYYFSYLKYIDRELLKMIDELKVNMAPDSIIIIHGDHSISLPEQNDKFKTLLTIFYPEKYSSACIPHDCTLVNLFRGLFNEILGTDYQLLPNKHISVDRYGNPAGNETLENISVQRLNTLVKKYHNKRVIIYGAGKLFEQINKNFDLSGFNIIALSDIRFKNDKLIRDNQLGYNIISPELIHTLKPDIVLICVLEPFYVEKYFNEQLFKNKQNRFRFEPIIQENSKMAIEKLFRDIV